MERQNSNRHAFRIIFFVIEILSIVGFHFRNWTLKRININLANLVVSSPQSVRNLGNRIVAESENAE